MAVTGFTGLNHLGLVSADVGATIRVWADRYGVGPWQVYTFDESNMRDATVDGRPVEFAMRVALCSVSPAFSLEVIQPLDDASPWAESLRRHGGADHLHHVRLEVAHYGDVLAHLQGLGLVKTFSATFLGVGGDEVTGTYLGTEDDLGFILEISQASPTFELPEPELQYPDSE
jgi:hypothetical protein